MFGLLGHQALSARAAAVHHRRLKQRRVVCSFETAESEVSGSTKSSIPTGSWKANVPIIGETLEYFSDPVEFMTSRFAEHGPVFRSHLFGRELYVVAPLEGWRETVMTNEFKTVSFYLLDSVRLLLDNPEDSLQQQDVHTAMRRNMGVAFSQDALAQYLPRIEGRIRSNLAAWSTQPQINLLDELETMTFGFASDIIVGLDVDPAAERQLVQQYRTFSEGLSTFPYDIPYTPFWNAKRARDELLATFAENADVLRQNMEQIDQRGRHNILYYAMLTEPAVTNKSLAIRALQFILAGHDTTRSSFSAMLLLLAQLPNVWEKVQQEQATVLTRHGEDVTPAALADMPYTEGVIKEVLRLLGPNRGLFRQALKDFDLFGRHISEGSTLFISSDGAHALDSALWQGKGFEHMDVYNLATSFRPEQWLVSPADSRPTLTAFGAGPHACMGMPLFYLEAKAFLAILARTYSWKIITPTATELKWIMLPFPRPSKDAIASFSKLPHDTQYSLNAVYHQLQ